MSAIKPFLFLFLHTNKIIMGAGPSVIYQDERAKKAEIAIKVYLIGEVIWLTIWACTTLSLELTEQVGLDADNQKLVLF